MTIEALMVRSKPARCGRPSRGAMGRGMRSVGQAGHAPGVSSRYARRPVTAGRQGAASGPFSFFDKDTLVPRNFAVTDNVRVVPGGTTIRRGAYLARRRRVHAAVLRQRRRACGTGTMIDSHALVGSCAQIGERVHLSAGVQIGGVLEPINAAPVIIENDVVVGGNCGVYEGTIVRSRAVLGAGVILTRGTPVYDLVRQTIYRASATGRSRSQRARWSCRARVRSASGWGASQGLAVHTPLWSNIGTTGPTRRRRSRRGSDRRRRWRRRRQCRYAARSACRETNRCRIAP